MAVLIYLVCFSGQIHHLQAVDRLGSFLGFEASHLSSTYDPDSAGAKSRRSGSETPPPPPIPGSPATPGTGPEFPFKCHMCPFSTAVEWLFRRHMTSHFGPRTFACTVCSYKCKLKANLQRHIRIHTGEKPFACSVCPYRSSDPSNLRAHKLMMHGTGV